MRIALDNWSLCNDGNNGIPWSMSNRTLIHNAAPFFEHLQENDVTDIVVNRPGEIGVEKAGRWHWYEEPFLTEERLWAIAIVAAYHTNEDISASKPIVTSLMPNGERLHIVRPPIVRGISFTIRRPPSFKPTLTMLQDAGMFSEVDKPQDNPVLASMAPDGLAEKLQHAVRNHKNILISGATGSGKTTLAKSLIAEIPLYERLITIEDTAEWNDLPHRNRVAKFYSKGMASAANLTSERVMESTLRMRPDRVLVGELRDEAAYTYLRVTVAGHPGGVTTLHGGSARGAVDALRLMVRQHPVGQSMLDEDVTAMLLGQIDIILHCHHDKQANTYRVTDIYEPRA